MQEKQLQGERGAKWRLHWRISSKRRKKGKKAGKDSLSSPPAAVFQPALSQEALFLQLCLQVVLGPLQLQEECGDALSCFTQGLRSWASFSEWVAPAHWFRATEAMAPPIISPDPCHSGSGSRFQLLSPETRQNQGECLSVIPGLVFFFPPFGLCNVCVCGEHQRVPGLLLDIGNTRDTVTWVGY